MGKISVVVNVVEAEVGVLPRALDSVRGLADEIVVIDMSTSGVPKSENLKVYKHDHLDWVEPVRNFGVSKTKGDWILILDPDEEIPASLAKELKRIISAKRQADYFRLPRKNIIFGKWVKHSRWWPDMNIRFFKKGFVSWSEIIHAVPTTQGRGADLEEKESLAIIHHHYETIDEYLKKMTRYTTQHAQLKIKEGYEFSWPDLIQKPVNEFLSRYFQGEGYKDGLHGLALATLQALSEFVLYLKTWEASKYADQSIGLEEVIDKMKRTEKDFHFWQADALYRKGGSISQRIKRKFKLP